MKPSHVAASLRRIASSIDSSRSPDRFLVARDVRHVLAAIDDSDIGERPDGSVIVIHRHGDETDVTRTSAVRPASGGAGELPLPNGDHVSFYDSMDALKVGEARNISDESLLEALFNAGLIDTDDDGEYII